MKFPRNLTGLEFIKLLKPFGYEVIRQTGSHIRIQTMQNGQHYETIPRHDPIKIGTLNNILKNIAKHFDLTKEELAKQLFE
ncbi:type II toxin-antitoxin system HicA family toxin [Spirosoma sp. KCTC 42546]|uniref:type II toxin-antitoxin system HicA family toxin n=1 Tax=Spirosoma sp. KCTC 42546 TaxID=2520506 RepID=UPI00115926C1|nr:type II toxin-antitoxin system HicA family toxin [Spirosoma sp. KCTC 42546]QDK78914.1 type II toxin-antitoxin system HicA family toxin [Spirosoma sp. KCTC 42546]